MKRLVLLAALAATPVALFAEGSTEIATRGLGVFIQPPEWAVTNIHPKHIVWGKHGNGEVMRLTDESASAVFSLIDACYERFAARYQHYDDQYVVQFQPPGASYPRPFYYAPRGLWPTLPLYTAHPAPAIRAEEWDGYPGGARAITNSTRLLSYSDIQAVLARIRPYMMNYTSQGLEDWLEERGLDPRLPVPQYWSDVPGDAVLTNRWINALPRWSELNVDPLWKTVTNDFSREHIASLTVPVFQYLGEAPCLEGVSEAISIANLFPIGCSEPSQQSLTDEALTAQDIISRWLGADLIPDYFLSCVGQRTMRLNWNEVGVLNLFLSRMQQSYLDAFDYTCIHSDAFETVSCSFSFTGTVSTRELYQGPVDLPISIPDPTIETNLVLDIHSSPVFDVPANVFTWDYKCCTGTNTSYWTGYGANLKAFAKVDQISGGFTLAASGGLIFLDQTVFDLLLDHTSSDAGDTVVVCCRIVPSDPLTLDIIPDSYTNLSTGFSASFGTPLPFVPPSVTIANTQRKLRFEDNLMATIVKTARSRYSIMPTMAPDHVNNPVPDALWNSGMLGSLEGIFLMGILTADGYLPGDWWEGNEPFFRYGDVPRFYPGHILIPRDDILLRGWWRKHNPPPCTSASEWTNCLFQTSSQHYNSFLDRFKFDSGRSHHAADWADFRAWDVDHLYESNITVRVGVFGDDRTCLLKGVKGGTLNEAYWQGDTNNVNHVILSDDGPQVHIGGVSISFYKEFSVPDTNNLFFSASSLGYVLPKATWMFKNLIEVSPE